MIGVEQSRKLKGAFPKMFINSNFEVILDPKQNTYFCAAGISTDLEVACKLLEWVSRAASKGGTTHSRKYCLDGLNKYFGENYTEEDMRNIYQLCGNQVSRERTINLIEEQGLMS